MVEKAKEAVMPAASLMVSPSDVRQDIDMRQGIGAYVSDRVFHDARPVSATRLAQSHAVYERIHGSARAPRFRTRLRAALGLGLE
jgi:hypothetical protein